MTIAILNMIRRTIKMLKKRTEKKAFFPGAVTISNGLYQESVMKRTLS